jgi:hypothetical protein
MPDAGCRMNGHTALASGSCFRRRGGTSINALPERMPGTPTRDESGCQAPPVNASTIASRTLFRLYPRASCDGWAGFASLRLCVFLGGRVGSASICVICGFLALGGRVGKPQAPSLPMGGRVAPRLCVFSLCSSSVPLCLCGSSSGRVGGRPLRLGVFAPLRFFGRARGNSKLKTQNSTLAWGGRVGGWAATRAAGPVGLLVGRSTRAGRHLHREGSARDWGVAVSPTARDRYGERRT